MSVSSKAVKEMTTVFFFLYLQLFYPRRKMLIHRIVHKLNKLTGLNDNTSIIFS